MGGGRHTSIRYFCPDVTGLFLEGEPCEALFFYRLRETVIVMLCEKFLMIGIFLLIGKITCIIFFLSSPPLMGIATASHPN